MKKPKKAKRSFKPTGRLPVLAIRVPEPLRERIKKSAELHKRNLSEEAMDLIQRGLDWNKAFEAGLLDRGFQRIGGTLHWVKAADLTTSAASIGTPALTEIKQKKGTD